MATWNEFKDKCLNLESTGCLTINFGGRKFVVMTKEFHNILVENGTIKLEE